MRTLSANTGKQQENMTYILSVNENRGFIEKIIIISFNFLAIRMQHNYLPDNSKCARVTALPRIARRIS